MNVDTRSSIQGIMYRLTIRGALVPVANFGSGISAAADHNGIIYQRRNVYIVYQSWDPPMFSLAVLFQIITLPVEFNASGRALKNPEKFRHAI